MLLGIWTSRVQIGRLTVINGVLTPFFNGIIWLVFFHLYKWSNFTPTYNCFLWAHLAGKHHRAKLDICHRSRICPNSYQQLGLWILRRFVSDTTKNEFWFRKRLYLYNTTFPRNVGQFCLCILCAVSFWNPDSPHCLVRNSITMG